MTSKRILVIAGSDSSGGAGVEADQKVIAAHGCYAMTATTALTAQNTLGVQDVHRTPPDFVRKLINAVCDDVGVDVVKTGMLASTETIQVVADAFRRYNITTSVVDPVMVSTSGSQLLPEDAVSTLIDELFPLTTILTPNLPEALRLLKIAGRITEKPETVDEFITTATQLQKLGPKWVLLKGGHLPFTKERTISKGTADHEVVLNVLVGDGTVSLLETIACNLATGMGMAKAVKRANLYIEAGIKTSTNIGRGNGPINHFHSTYTLPFTPGSFIAYLLDREDIQAPWEQYTKHSFVQQMGDGTLPLRKFMYYLVQDYLFLVQFARATALSAYKTNSLADIGQSVQQIVTLQEEIKLHIAFCRDYGLSEEDITQGAEDQATTAYTRYVLDIGQSQDWLALQIALLPCLIGYGVIAKRLYEDPNSVRVGSHYWKWIEQYNAEEYHKAIVRGSNLIEKHATKLSPSRVEELAQIFIHATNMERGFWDMGLQAGEEMR